MAVKVLFGMMLLGLLGFSPVSHAQSVADAPWPTYRGNLNRSGYSTGAGPATNARKWVFSTGRAEKDGGIETDPVLGPDGTLYIGANNGIFYALEAETGRIRWIFPTNFDTYAIYSSPFVDKEGTVYFGAKDGNVYALKAPREGILGKIIWSLNLGTTIQTSPAFTPDGTLVIGADDWAYYGISPPRGSEGPKVKWRFQTQGTLISSPAVDADGTVFVASMDGKVYALETPGKAGGAVKVRWSFATGDRDEKGGFENAPALDGRGTLYIGANNGILYALDTATGKVRWTFDGVARAGYRTYAIFSSVAIGPDRTLYFGGKNGVLYAIREHRGFFSTGAEVQWRYNLGAGVQSSPLATADGTVFLGDEKGTLHAVRPPKSGGWAKALWKFATRGTLISSPAVAPDGTLYQGSMDGKLYAFHAPGSGSVAEGPFTGTWYGDYEGGLASRKVRAVLVRQESHVEAAWFASGVGRGRGAGVVQGDRITVSMPIENRVCRGTVQAEGRLKDGEIRSAVRIDSCAGKVVTGVVRLRNRGSNKD